MSRWAFEGQEKSVAVAWQSAFGTAATTGFQAIKASVELPAPTRELEDMQFGTSQSGAYEPPVAGSKHGTEIVISGPIESCKSGYDGTSEAPIGTSNVGAYTAALLFHALGGDPTAVSSNQNFLDLKSGYPEVYDTGVVGHAGDVVTVDAASGANYDVGNLLFVSTGTTDTSPTLGFIKSIAGDALTLFETAQNTAAASDLVWPTATVPFKTIEPNPLTIRIVGPATEDGLKYIDALPQAGSITFAPGKTPTYSITYVSQDRQWDATIGTLLTPTSFLRVPPVTGSGGNAGYMTYNGASTKITELTVSWEHQIAWLAGATGSQGKCEAVYTGSKVTASFAIPHNSSDTITSGEHVYELDLLNGSTFSVGAYVGSTPGRVAALLLPALHHEAQPTLELIDGVMHHRFSARCSPYTGDGASTKAGNSYFRFAIG